MKSLCKSDFFSLGIVFLLGLMHLPYPFATDQALFTLGAMKMSQGALLYRDFWDLKQPGIFVFYFLAGKLFGFNEIGIHTLELIYMLAFSGVLIWCCRHYFRERWLVSLVPLFTVGVYYGVANDFHLTQVESLVGFPIFLSLYWAGDTGEHRARSLFLSGLMGGLVLQFKFVLAPMPLCFWLTGFLYSARHSQTNFTRELLRGVLPVLGGVVIPVAAVLLWFARVDNVGPLLYTTFEYPILVARELPKFETMGTLLLSMQWFLANFASLIALAFVSCLVLDRSTDFITLNLELWIVVGLCLILVQRYSWWEYHFFLLLVPLGILTVKAIEIVWGQLRRTSAVPGTLRRQLPFALFLAILFSPVIWSWTVLGLRLVRHRFALDLAERRRLQDTLNPMYERATNSVAFLRQPGSLQGDIFVFGPTLYYFIARRNQAVAMQGSMPLLLLPRQWSELRQQLAHAMPPYIYLADEQVELIRSRAPAILQFLYDNYRRSHNDKEGTWYVVKRNAAIAMK